MRISAFISQAPYRSFGVQTGCYRAVTVIGTEWDLGTGVYKIEVAGCRGRDEPAPVFAGVKMTAVPELTLVASLWVPAAVGLRERFTVLVNAPVPVTVGVQDVVWVSVMEVGLQMRETAVIVGVGGGAGAAMAIFAVPQFW